MEIMYAKIEDSKEIFDILKGVGREAYTLDLVKDLITTEKSLSLKLVMDNKIIGALGARAEGKNSGWLYYIVIHKDFREREYSKELMNKFFEEAIKKGIKRIALDTPDKKFFEKFGFKVVGRIPNWYEDQDQIIMFKEI